MKALQALPVAVAAVLLLTSGAIALQQNPNEIIKLPQFDPDKDPLTKNITPSYGGKVRGAYARYVVSVPSNYDKDKSYPLILDLHGAAGPKSESAKHMTRVMWAPLADKIDCIFVAPNCRFRMWGRWGRKTTDPYILHVIEKVKKEYNVDPNRMFLSGFSSGSNYICGASLQSQAKIQGTLVVCPGPNIGRIIPSIEKGKNTTFEQVVLGKKKHPFYFLVGENDLRKPGAWKLFVGLDALGRPAMFQEMPGKAHKRPSHDQYANAFRYLEWMGNPKMAFDCVQVATDAMGREEYLLASTLFLEVIKANRNPEETAKAKALLDKIKATGMKQLEAAEAQCGGKPDRSHNGKYWKVRSRFHRFPSIADKAQERLDQISAIPKPPRKPRKPRK